jgi:hypothetical protein
MEMLRESVACNYRKEFVSSGSLIMYRNQEGKFQGIEFYYEFLK